MFAGTGSTNDDDDDDVILTVGPSVAVGLERMFYTLFTGSTDNVTVGQWMFYSVL